MVHLWNDLVALVDPIKKGQIVLVQPYMPIRLYFTHSGGGFLAIAVYKMRVLYTSYLCTGSRVKHHIYKCLSTGIFSIDSIISPSFISGSLSKDIPQSPPFNTSLTSFLAIFSCFTLPVKTTSPSLINLTV